MSVEREKKEKNFKITVISACYNVAPYLEECIESIIAQDIGFSDFVQCIFVNDGSTDETARILDGYSARYPDNITVIHKENGGVASARNTGVPYALGEYINFTDPDDKLSENLFSTVYAFFEKCRNKLDIVTVPIRFFDALEGEHWQNKVKFSRGSRIIDILTEPEALLMFVNASFFHKRVKERLVFDGSLACGEDIKLCLQIIFDKLAYGAVTGCEYLYRRRTSGDSLIQLKEGKRSFYFEHFDNLFRYAREESERRFGRVLDYVSYMIASELKWRYEQWSRPEVLDGREYEEYKARTFAETSLIDDRFILSQPLVFAEHKCFMLSKKYGRLPDLTPRPNGGALLHFGNTVVTDLAYSYTVVERLSFGGGKLVLEGFSKVMGCTDEEEIKLFVRMNGRLIPTEYIPRPELDEYCFDELSFRALGFRVEITVPKIDVGRVVAVSLVLSLRGINIEKRGVRLSRGLPLTTRLKKTYFEKDGLFISFGKDTIWIKNPTKKQKKVYKRELLRELSRGNREMKKAAAVHVLCRFLSLFKRKSLWLIADRIDRGGDNGEAMALYMKGKRSEIRTVFCISRACRDYYRLKRAGINVVPLGSRRHKLLYLMSDALLTSHTERAITSPLEGVAELYGDLGNSKKTVFLQHGIIKDDLSYWFGKYKTDIDLFVTSSEDERKSVIGGDYHYTQSEVALLGLARYDRLYNDRQKIILLAPTWRAYLVSSMSQSSGERLALENAAESRFVREYSALLSDTRLLSLLGKHGFRLALLGHPNMRRVTELLNPPASVLVWDGNVEYRDALAAADLLITDYSSVMFDFAYLEKPTVYYQFDCDEFFSGGHTYRKGYFDYERDGFGEIAYEREQLISLIGAALEKGCRMDEKYRERVKRFFAFHDKNNCERIYNATKRLTGLE